jgi:uncharacterized protein YjbI with pentapeptide repeats
LVDADLRGAYAREARFEAATLVGANLSGADFQRARFWAALLGHEDHKETVFRLTDLRDLNIARPSDEELEGIRKSLSEIQAITGSGLADTVLKYLGSCVATVLTMV